MSNFTHIHVHTENSRLDGLSKSHELLEVAQSYGMTALAITDHGTTAGLWKAQKHADKLGMKLIHGNEFYYERENDGENGHLLVLAKNNVGLRNIFKMQEISYSAEQFKRNPRINWDILCAHSEGLIVTSACLGSPFNQMIMAGDIGGAREWARKFKAVFSEDFYIEIQPNDIPEQHTCNLASIRIAKELNIELVATNDVHYTYETDCFPHEVLLAIQVKKKMDDEKRFKFPSDDFWLRSEEEMYEAFSDKLPLSDVQRAMTNTKVIESKCDARITPGKYLPRYYKAVDKADEDKQLRKLAYDGTWDRELDDDAQYNEALEHELAVVAEEGYSGYFLIVADYIRSARERGEIVGPGRGSGAGSKIAYSTEITDIAPHHYDLLFERFMSKGRSPDVDTDFSNQNAVFYDLQQKYGQRNVARIAAYGTLTPRSCIRRVFSAFNHPAHLIAKINSYIPDLCDNLDDAIKVNSELLSYKQMYPVEWGVIERLQNVISHVSTHAAGVIIYDNLSDYIPLLTSADDRGFLISALDKKEVEEFGFYKFDVLGLETLPVLQGVIESIERTTGEKIILKNLPLDDDAVYGMLRLGDVSGVFQLASQAAKVMEQAPHEFTDLIAISALIRPGVGDWSEYMARRLGKDYELYEPRKPYMGETYGTMTYQEQYLLDGHILAGWEVAYADKHLRKNRDIRNDVELREKFFTDTLANGHPREEMEHVWSEIENAVDGGYGFNKSHSAAYGLITYYTAYLKHHYPEHFYASLMSSAKTDGDGQDEISGYIAECKTRGINILPPHINDSTDSFAVTEHGINYRITTIKHVGDSAIQHINDLRPINSFDDFLSRREKSKAKKNVVVNLIKAGAFDFDNPNRAELLHQFDMTQRTKTQIKEDFVTPTYHYDDKVKMAWEMEVLGMYLSVHPLERYGFRELDEFKDGQACLQGGEIYDMRVFNDKNGKEMAFIHINTLFGNVKILVFQSTWSNKSIRNMMRMGNIILVKGRRSGNDVIFNEGELLEGELVSDTA